MRAGFDAAAAGWDDSRGSYRRPVLADALARGGPFRPGRAVEIASGTGLLTPLIAQVWPEVIAVDLSGGMLARSAHVLWPQERCWCGPTHWGTAPRSTCPPRSWPER